MFDKDNLKKVDKQPVKSVGKTTSAFVAAATKETSKIKSAKGALKYEKTNNVFVDDFTKLSEYIEPRKYADVARTMSTLWAESPRLAIVMAFYTRLITRKTDLPNGTSTDDTQRGAGLISEAIMRFMWLAVNHPGAFKRNAHLIPVVGSWKDIFEMLRLDDAACWSGDQYEWDAHALDWNFFTKLIIGGLHNPHTSNLVRKFMPSIPTKKSCNTRAKKANRHIAKFLAHRLFDAAFPGDDAAAKSARERAYRLAKRDGTAHSWQQLISRGQHAMVDFDKIHGRALSKLVKGKYLENQGLTDKYTAWATSKKTIKYTGFVHELFKGVDEYARLRAADVETLNKQFLELVRKAKIDAGDSRMIMVRDTSGSMSSEAPGTGMSCGNVAKALTLFISYLLPDGYFKDSWIEFNHSAKLHRWVGETPLEKWANDRTGFYGPTNFLSVIDLFCTIKAQGVPESEFPTGIACVSDMEFDNVGLDSNYNEAKKLLRRAGFSDSYVDNFRVVLWNLQNRYHGDKSSTKFEEYDAATKGIMYLSGFDGSIISFIVDTPNIMTAEQLFMRAMDQEVLNLVQY